MRTYSCKRVIDVAPSLPSSAPASAVAVEGRVGEWEGEGEGRAKLLHNCDVRRRGMPVSKAREGESEWERRFQLSWAMQVLLIMDAVCALCSARQSVLHALAKVSRAQLVLALICAFRDSHTWDAHAGDPASGGRGGG